MRPADRWILAISLLLIDALLFVVPLAGLLGAYVLVVRPPWFRGWVEQLYAGGPGAGPTSGE